jgi:4-oxalocrotonate tautomerase
MPFVNVHLVGPLNQEQKQKIAEDITNSLEKHAGKKKETTYVEFLDQPGTQWAVGGKMKA